MNHLDNINPKLFKAIYDRNRAAATFTNCLLDPILTPIYVWRRDYKKEKMDISKNIIAEYNEVLGRVAPWKRTPLNRFVDMWFGAITKEAGLYTYNLIRTKNQSSY